MTSLDETRHVKAAVVGKASKLADRRLSGRKKLLFAVFAVCCLLTLLELALAVYGVKPRLTVHDPFVGFAPDIPLFVEETTPDGQVFMVTAANKLTLFNWQAFPQQKPANTCRVVCVGGSTTRGFPFNDSTSYSGWLRQWLPIVAPSRNWEVINAGASSYASYRVARTMEELCQYKPDLFIICTGHNEFMERRTYGALIDAPEFVLAAEALFMRTRIYTAVEKLVGGMRVPKSQGDEDEKVFKSDVQALSDMQQVIGWADYSRDDRLRGRILRHCRFNLERMIQIAHGASADVLLIVPACNLLHWSPYKSEHRAGLSERQQARCQSLLRQAQQAQEQEDLPTALEACDEFLEIDDRYALAHFRRGRILYALGQYSAAKVALERARDEDVCSLRALTSIQQLVRQTAAKYKLPLVDFTKLIEVVSQHGIAGDQYFFDDVHPKVAVHGLLATELLETLSSSGLVPSKSNWDRDSMQTTASAIEGSIDGDQRAIALIEVSQTHLWAGREEESVRLARQALAQSPQFEQAIDNLAGIHWKFGQSLLEQGKMAPAARHFCEVLRLMPNHMAAKQQLQAVERLLEEE